MLCNLIKVGRKKIICLTTGWYLKIELRAKAAILAPQKAKHMLVLLLNY